ncbi:MAG TPA: DUF1343 domain-containing protein [Saprospiraceae bacterium]|nr:DUF1343 domain-containing protein [Saprospiraceae bacterium]
MKQIRVNIKIFVLILSICVFSCQNQTSQAQSKTSNGEAETAITVGAARTDAYLPLLRGKSIGMVVNQTSTIGNTHLVDSLLASGIKIIKIFAPEHGFRGQADAGEKVSDGKDNQTGLPIASLYGAKRKPAPTDLAGIDLMVFDIQDVGARFYTYISTMHYIMEACAENDIPMLVLDRPNPNGHYVDGPVLDTSRYRSFVGMHPIPTVHGMTIGEYAQMVNGERWLVGGLQCDLTVIPCENYSHDRPYILPIKPSPNLPNNRAIYLYPSICLFEGTVFSLGRGTSKQFQVIGAPDYPQTAFSFTPVSRPGATYPKHEDKTCYGLDLTQLLPEQIFAERQLNLSYLLDIYQTYPHKDKFFLESNFFEKLSGNDELKAQLIAGKSEAEIRASWEPELGQFKESRKKYLLYD